MNSLPEYYDDTYKFSSEAKVLSVSCDERGKYLVLDRTIFYPQGGGQPSDVGCLRGEGLDVEIYTVRAVENEIRHYTKSEEAEHAIGMVMQLSIDAEKRVLHAKLHTSGHLISNVVESLYPHLQAVKGHHFPNEAYVEFFSKRPLLAVDIEEINKHLNEVIDKNLQLQKMVIKSDELQSYCPNLPYSVKSGEQVRLLAIAPYAYQPCGGTHVNSTGELSGLKCTKYKMKGASLRITYQ